MKQVFLLLAAAITFFFTASPADAAQISGKVLDKDDNPVIGATVTAKSVDSETVGTAESDFSGNYSLFIPDGRYAVTVIHPTESDQETSFAAEELTGTVQRDLKITGETNAPIPDGKSAPSYMQIAGVAGGLLLAGGIIRFLLRKKK